MVHTIAVLVLNGGCAGIGVPSVIFDVESGCDTLDSIEDQTAGVEPFDP